MNHEIDIPLDDEEEVSNDTSSSDAPLITSWQDVKQFCFEKTGLNVSDSETIRIAHIIMGLSAGDIQRLLTGLDANLNKTFKAGSEQLNQILEANLLDLIKKIDAASLEHTADKINEQSQHITSINNTLKSFKSFMKIITVINVVLASITVSALFILGAV